MQMKHITPILTMLMSLQLFCYTFPSIRSPRKKIVLKDWGSFNSKEEDESKGISLKVVGTFALLTVGVFGTGFIGTLSNTLKSVNTDNSVQTTPNQRLKGDTNSENRGALTKLTKKEILGKLRSIPVFFASIDNGKSIFVRDGEARLFVDEIEAMKFSKSLISSGTERNSLSVSATSLDDIYFTLVDKKTKIAKYLEGLSVESDNSATYKFQASEQVYESTSPLYKKTHTRDDIPLFRVPNLVFSKATGLEFPLFFTREDALTSYRRLQDTLAAEGKTGAIGAETATVQETSLLDVIKLFQTGGFEARALEFYPPIDSLNRARALMSLPPVAITP